MREISAIAKDLTDAASDIQKKHKALVDANSAQDLASNEYSSALAKGTELRAEMESAYAMLVPSSTDPRVRQSS